MKNRRILGIAALLFAIMLITAIFNQAFLSPYNIKNLLRWTGLFGILSLGVGFVIMTGGIDLSVGAIVGLIGVLFANVLKVHRWPIPMALLFVIAIAICLGLIHGLLVTKLKLQPFVVTLCGLFVYRGAARFYTNDVTQGYGSEFVGLKFLAGGKIPADLWPSNTAPKFFLNWSLPMPFIIMIIVAIILAIFLNRSIYGRYILALGRNEDAARFSGINTDRMIIVTYMISAFCAGLAGILFSLDLNTVQPSTAGNTYELYAIAGCVVGGISLKGGTGNILGVIIGVAIVRVLYNAINIIGIATTLEFAVIGMVILIGVGTDEVIRIISEKRRILNIKNEISKLDSTVKAG